MAGKFFRLLSPVRRIHKNPVGSDPTPGPPAQFLLSPSPIQEGLLPFNTFSWLQGSMVGPELCDFEKCSPLCAGFTHCPVMHPSVSLSLPCMRPGPLTATLGGRWVGRRVYLSVSPCEAKHGAFRNRYTRFFSFHSRNSWVPVTPIANSCPIKTVWASPTRQLRCPAGKGQRAWLSEQEQNPGVQSLPSSPQGYPAA